MMLVLLSTLVEVSARGAIDVVWTTTRRVPHKEARDAIGDARQPTADATDE